MQRYQMHYHGRLLTSYKSTDSVANIAPVYQQPSHLIISEKDNDDDGD